MTVLLYSIYQGHAAASGPVPTADLWPAHAVHRWGQDTRFKGCSAIYCYVRYITYLMFTLLLLWCDWSGEPGREEGPHAIGRGAEATARIHRPGLGSRYILITN